MPSFNYPLRFFENLFETDYLVRLRNDFMPDESDLKHWIHRYPHTIDEEQGSYTIEYSGHGEEIYPGKFIWINDENEWHKKTYVFEEFLGVELSNAQEECIALMNELLWSKKDRTSGQYTCLLLLDELNSYKNKSNNAPFKNYKNCKEALIGLMIHLLEKYSSISYSVNYNEKTLKQLRLSIPGNTIPRPQLMHSIYKALAALKDEDEKDLLDYDDEQYDLEQKRIANALKYIAAGYPHYAQGLLKFQWDIMPVYYIFKKLSTYSNKMDLRALEKSNKVVLKKGIFKAANCYSNSLRYEQNPGKKAALKTQIDNLFEAHKM